MRRAKLYLCAIDLLRNYDDMNGAILEKAQIDSVLLRFKGRTRDGIYYIVQVKYNIRSNRKDLISVYPVDDRGKK